VPLGIEKIALYASRLKVDALQIGAARGRDVKEIAEQVMVCERSVIPLCEDAISMAVNAARALVSAVDRDEIDLLIVTTESAVDFGKPLSTWVHHYLGLSPNCRNFEIKHACYGGTAGFRTAAAFIASGATRGRKALVISTDFSRPALDSGVDFAGGGCAVAFLVSLDPQVLSIELDNAGYWTNHVYDVFRPTALAETGDNQLSLFSYLDALDGACAHYEKVNGETDFDSAFRKHIYHAPFPGMTFQAHRTLMRRKANPDKRAVRASFDAKVADGLRFARRIGAAYGASNFLCLLGLLGSPGDSAAAAGDRVSFFSYGSGCQAEFYGATIGPGAREYVRTLNIDEHLDSRISVSVEGYEQIEQLRERSIECPDFVPGQMDPGGLVAAAYRNTGLLVLRRVTGYQREYDWA
jgi:hydroxymethylglutaryl-CoA synthase